MAARTPKLHPATGGICWKTVSIRSGDKDPIATIFSPKGMKEGIIFCETNIASWMKECGGKVVDPGIFLGWVVGNTIKDRGVYL
ncbi:MAG: hypothetical protein JJT76_09515 [Clostridiaceae bacterium]|nr:hypothetical protein [Clostridiaceae bacterium]